MEDVRERGDASKNPSTLVMSRAHFEFKNFIDEKSKLHFRYKQTPTRGGCAKGRESQANRMSSPPPYGMKGEKKWNKPPNGGRVTGFLTHEDTLGSEFSRYRGEERTAAIAGRTQK